MSSNKPLIGFCGLGKLGLPLAVSVASRGFKVLGYDISPSLMKKRKYEHLECGPDGTTADFQDYFDKADITFLPLKELLQQADIVFVAVQTPHGPLYEGTTRLPFTRADFNYTYLKEACAEIAKYRHPNQTIAVVSTVLPGTMRREVIPLIPDLVYNPAFPAMGTVMENYLNPEFVLMGSDDLVASKRLEDYYKQLYPQFDTTGQCELVRNLICKTSIESAELSKVAYNLFISFKVAYANTLMEIAHKIPRCDVDEVVSVLSRADKRLLSSAYMKGGLGDGGSCHPRDAIAMSWITDKLRLSCDPFDHVMRLREWQTEWLADLLLSHSFGMRKIILGKAYKPGTNITTGSCALLLVNILKEKHAEFEHYDPYVDDGRDSGKVDQPIDYAEPAAFLIATKHEVFQKYTFARGSVVLDPFRYMPAQQGVKIIPVGIGR